MEEKMSLSLKRPFPFAEAEAEADEVFFVGKKRVRLGSNGTVASDVDKIA